MPQPVRQLLPGVVHWESRHPRIGMDVSSYLLTESAVAIDPLVPPDGIEWFDEHVAPREVLLSNRHHLRDAKLIAERFGAGIHASRPGMHEFTPEDRVTPFDFGDVLPGGIVAHEIGVICPDETAFEIPDVRALSVADGVVNYDGLKFVPDSLLGDDPEAVRAGLLAAYGRLVETVDFDHLLVAHGEPVVLEGRRQLQDFVASGGVSAAF
jgi:hypothetical protein